MHNLRQMIVGQEDRRIKTLKRKRCSNEIEEEVGNECLHIYHITFN